jgi:hypothetical protein
VPHDTTLSVRALNRALLARQWLLERQRATASKAIEHLVGLQAQNTQPPYFALWSRLKGFDPRALSTLLLERKAVRLALMRSTIHLVTGRDCLKLRPVLQRSLERVFHTGSPFGKRLGDFDYSALTQAARALFLEQPRTTSEVGKLLRERWPRCDAEAMGNAARTYLALVQLPPRGVWGDGAMPLCALAEDWLRKPLGASVDLAAVVLRYLRAFGPATVADARTWSGLRDLEPTFERLRKKLRTFRDERGRELFDVPRAPLPDETVAAPPRFVGEYDNLLLSHEDRSRVLPEGLRKRLFDPNGVKPALLVDGFVLGAWRLEVGETAAVVRIDAFEPLPKKQVGAVKDEALALARFAAPDAKRHQVTLRQGAAQSRRRRRRRPRSRQRQRQRQRQRSRQ